MNLHLNTANLARSEVTDALTRGVCRLFRDMGFASILEFKLPNGRRADVAALDRRGRLFIVEVKSCQADFDSDMKWSEYLGYCDAFYFAVDPNFPHNFLPSSQGLIIADAYGGAIMRNAEEHPIGAARRKAVTLRFARQAAQRAAALGDGAGLGRH